MKHNTFLPEYSKFKSDNNGCFCRMIEGGVLTSSYLFPSAGFTLPFCLLLPSPLISPVAADVDVFTGGSLKRISYTLSN